jgi:hypothetical protein
MSKKFKLCAKDLSGRKTPVGSVTSDGEVSDEEPDIDTESIVVGE